MKKLFFFIAICVAAITVNAAVYDFTTINSEADYTIANATKNADSNDSKIVYDIENGENLEMYLNAAPNVEFSIKGNSDGSKREKIFVVNLGNGGASVEFGGKGGVITITGVNVGDEIAVTAAAKGSTVGLLTVQSGATGDDVNFPAKNKDAEDADSNGYVWVDAKYVATATTVVLKETNAGIRVTRVTVEEPKQEELTPATWYGAGEFVTTNEYAEWAGFVYGITRNANKTLTYEIEFTNTVVGLVVRLNDGEYRDPQNDGLKYTYTTEATYEDGETVTGHFYFPYANGDARIDYTYTVGAENEKPAMPEQPVEEEDGLKGDYVIGGEQADYATLADAFTAINDANAENKIIGDIRLLVAADLVEPKNVGIQNSSDYTITLTVDDAVARKITFTQTADNAGPSGNICIGCDMSLTHACANVLTQNVIIDGSFNGDGERWLTLETAATVQYYNGPILIYGYVKDCTIRNTNMFVYNNNSGSQNWCVSIRNQNAANSTYAPDGVLLENNYMKNVSGTMSGAIYLQKSGNGTGKPANVKVLNNIIEAVHRAVYCEHANNMMFVGNSFKVNQTSTKADSYAILPSANIEGDVIVRNNVFLELTTKCTDATNGMTGISVTGGGRWWIENNYFTGLDNYSVDDKGNANGNGKLMAIRTGSGQEFMKIRHNTFVMPVLTYAPVTELLSGNPVSLIYAAGGNPEIENNIFVCEETVANVSLIRGTITDKIKNNVFYHNGGNAAIVAGGVVAMDWETFTANGANAGSVWVMPNFVDAANGDLDLVEATTDLLMPRLDDVLTDIYGTERAEMTCAGAFETTNIKDDPDTPTALDNALNNAEVKKVMIDGQIYIVRDGVRYNLMGMQVR